MKSRKILLLAIAALISAIVHCVMPSNLLIAAVMWAACLLPEKTLTRKSALTLLYVPFSVILFTVLFVVLNVVLAATSVSAQASSDSVVQAGVAVGISTVLAAFGMFVLLLALRHRKTVRLSSLGFLLCTTLAFGIRIFFLVQTYKLLRSLAEPTDTMELLQLSDSPEVSVQQLVSLLTYYLPALGLLLSRPKEMPDAEMA